MCNPQSGCLCSLLRHKPAEMASPSWRMGRSASPMPLWLWPTPLACVNPLCEPPAPSPQAPGHSLPLPCPARIIALYSFSLQMQGRSLCSKPILLEEFKSLLSLDSRYLLGSFSVLHLALKHLCGFIIGFHIKFVSKRDTISSWINFVCCA